MEETSPKPGLAWWVVAATFSGLWIIYLIFFLPRGSQSPSLGGTADYKWTLQDLNDAPVEFAKYKGKAVFLNIWATWCPPCVGEMPSIARLAANPRLKDVAFVCVSTDDDAETVRAFLRDKDWSMTILRATNIPRVFATDGIPATFIIAPDGHIAFSEIGSADWDSPENVERLATLAKEPATMRP